MKRAIIAVITVLICLLSCFNPMSALAKDKVGQSEIGVPNYDLYSNFMNNQYKTIAGGNRMYLSTIESCSNLEWFIERASVIVGEELSEERCIEILANMAFMMNYQLEDILVNQASFDTTKQIKDYAVDVAGILAGTVGADEALKEAIGPTVETISTMMGIDSGLINLTCDSIEDFELLNQLVADYKMQYNFLNCVAKYASLEEMRQAAETLLNVDKEIFLNKLKTFNSVTENVALFLGNDVFFDQIATKLLSDPSNFEDAATAEAAGYLSSLAELYGKAELSFDLTIFAGDMLFGTSNAYNRYNEMKALQDIRCAILKDISHNTPEAETDYDTMWHNIDMLKMVQYVDARGEYCCYQFVVYEGQFLSVLQMKNRETIQHNYEASIDICEIMLENIDQIITIDASTSMENDEDAICAGAVEAYKEACSFYSAWVSNDVWRGPDESLVETYELGNVGVGSGEYYGKHCRTYDDKITTTQQLQEAMNNHFTSECAKEYFDRRDPIEDNGKLFLLYGGPWGADWSGVDTVSEIQKIDEHTYEITVIGDGNGGRLTGKIGFEYIEGTYHFYPAAGWLYDEGGNRFYSGEFAFYLSSSDLKLPEDLSGTEKNPPPSSPDNEWNKDTNTQKENPYKAYVEVVDGATETVEGVDVTVDTLSVKLPGNDAAGQRIMDVFLSQKEEIYEHWREYGPEIIDAEEELTLEVTRADARIISVYQIDRAYYGGQHSYPSWKCYTFSSEDGKALALPDLSSDTAALQDFLSSVCREQVPQFSDYGIDYVSDRFQEGQFEWGMDSEGMYVYLTGNSYYELYEFSVPYSDLAPYIYEWVLPTT